jgi:allantoate deiminase
VPTATDTAIAKVLERCQTLARFSELPGSTRRTFLSTPMRDCHAEIGKWLATLGIQTRIDAAGNLRALYPAASSDAPAFLIGSHLDTVPNAGAYDGILGVVLAVALLESLEGRRLPFAIELLGLSEEEGVRFGVPFIGSRALVGRLDEELLARQDAHGISVRHAIEDFGLQPSAIPQAALGPNVLGFLEFHIEQGPLLADLNLPLAVVASIVGQSRLEFTFTGHANHAGTTPMHLRRDALAGAAEWIGAIERAAKAVPGLVATVGAIEAQPGVANCIAGQARVSLDVRHASDETRRAAATGAIQIAQQIARSRKLQVAHKTLLDQRATPMDPFLVDQLASALSAIDCQPHRMASGAGHDAMILAEKVPSAMLFLRTPGGVSHDPSETVEPADIAKALACGLRFLDQLSQSTDFLTRTRRA